MSKTRSRKTSRHDPTEDRANATGAMRPEAKAELDRRLWDFSVQLRDVADPDKLLLSALRLSLDFFQAPEGCLVTIRPGGETAEIALPHPADSRWDLDLLAGFLRGRKVEIPLELMLARIRRFGRMWGALVLRRPRAAFGWDARQGFSRVGGLAAEFIDRIDRQRVQEVRSRIDRKIIEQIRPQDLFYKILHGIRSLVGYDHSAAVLTCGGDRDTLEIVAEQIAWRKSKSQKTGLKLPLSEELLKLLGQETVYGFSREGKRWCDWTGSQAAALAELLDYNQDGLPREVSTAENTMLCAPLVTRNGFLGVIKVAAIHPGTFGPYEAELVSQFLPQAAVAMQNLRRAESLEMRMQAAERKQAMADLARGVSHDVNNALGSVLPLVQQLRADLAEGVLEPSVAAEDLEQIERSLQVCRRIFGGMLSFARSAARNPSEVHLWHEVDTTLAIFREGLQRRGIAIEVEVPSDLPPIFAVQADVEQLLINLVGNARDALRSGGRLSIRAALRGEGIELEIADTGCGIPPEDLPKIQEPFFTTKPSGNGLGLSICRSIISQMRGKMRIESEVGKGTAVRVTLPVVAEAQA